MNRRILVIVFVLLLLATPALAQDTDPVPPTPITVEEAAELLLAAITAIGLGGLAGAPVTTFLVNLAKRIKALESVSASTIQLVIGTLLTALFWVAQRYGFEAQFNSVSELIVAAGPILLSLFATLSGSAVIYNTAKKAGDPAFGYQRPLPATPREFVR